MKSRTRVATLMFLLVFLPGSFRAQDDTRIVHEGVVNAPVDQVWAARSR